MDTWTPLSPADVVAELAPDELAALRNIAGAIDNLPGLTARVTGEIQDAYQSGGRAMGDPGTIPDAVKSHAIALVRWRLLISSPQLKSLQTPERGRAADQALAFLSDISHRKLGGGGSAQIASQNPRQATRRQLSGL